MFAHRVKGVSKHNERSAGTSGDLSCLMADDKLILVT